MKGVSELTDFYYQNLFPILKKLEDDKKTLRKKIITIGIIYTLFTFFIIYILNSYYDFIIFAYIALGTIIYKFMVKDYTHEFKQKSTHPLHISFIGSHIYLAIESNKDMFEPSIFSSLLNYKVAMEYVKTLHLAIGIVEELKLNQKLWSKR